MLMHHPIIFHRMVVPVRLNFARETPQNSHSMLSQLRLCNQILFRFNVHTCLIYGSISLSNEAAKLMFDEYVDKTWQELYEHVGDRNSVVFEGLRHSYKQSILLQDTSTLITSLIIYGGLSRLLQPSLGGASKSTNSLDTIGREGYVTSFSRNCHGWSILSILFAGEDVRHTVFKSMAPNLSKPEQRLSAGERWQQVVGQKWNHRVFVTSLRNSYSTSIK